MNITKEEVIEELKNEIIKRESVYGNMVVAKKMTSETMALKIARIHRAIELVKAAPEPESSVVIKNLVWQARELFDKAYQHHKGMAYIWSVGKGGGKDMADLKKLCERIRLGIATHRQAKGDTTDVGDQDVLGLLTLMLFELPKFYLYNTFTPGQLYGQYNNITSAINADRKAKSAEAKGPETGGFVPD
jgi:hypothetical protein